MRTAADKENVAVEKVFGDSENAQSEKSEECIRQESRTAQGKAKQYKTVWR